jgi:hypothetical protein
MFHRILSTTLGVIGAIVGGVFGYVLFFWIVGQGFYALMLPGASIGLGCGLLARHRSFLRGVICAFAAVLLGLYTEWRFSPFVADPRFSYLAWHFYDLKPITQIMIGLGAALAFYLGKDAGFRASWSGPSASPTAGVQSARDRDD